MVIVLVSALLLLFLGVGISFSAMCFSMFFKDLLADHRDLWELAQPKLKVANRIGLGMSLVGAAAALVIHFGK
jgi:hypothetical protein